MSTSKQQGFSLVELSVTVALLGILMSVALLDWQGIMRRSNLASSTQVIQASVQRARLLSIFRGLNHFVVLDPDNRTVEIFEDSSAPINSFDNGDIRLEVEQWSGSVAMTLPGEPSPLTDPLGGGTITNAWSLPVPDASARWGSDLRGVMTTPRGRIMSAEATPQVIGLGQIVLNDSIGGAAVVAVDGSAGAVRGFVLVKSSWKQL
jgi:prepilin-type N-terminal cleavage/methylation domain-containing protein